jgi:hypothetical protein
LWRTAACGITLLQLFLLHINFEGENSIQLSTTSMEFAANDSEIIINHEAGFFCEERRSAL